jgi:hypothetical protein
MRPLEDSEIDAVNGGVIPLLIVVKVVGKAVVGKKALTTAATTGAAIGGAAAVGALNNDE